MAYWLYIMATGLRPKKAAHRRKGKGRMIEIPDVDEHTDLVELRQTLRGAAIEAGLSATGLAQTEGGMIATRDIPLDPMIGNTGFRSLLASPPSLGTWKVLRARLVVNRALGRE